MCVYIWCYMQVSAMKITCAITLKLQGTFGSVFFGEHVTISSIFWCYQERI